MNNKGTDRTAIYVKTSVFVCRNCNRETYLRQDFYNTGSLCSWANWIVSYLVANPVFMSTCLWINSACWVIFRGVCYLQTFSCPGPGPSRNNFKKFETLSKFRAWSESGLFANVISCDSWSKRPTIFKQPLVFYQVACVVSVAMTHENVHYIIQSCQTLNTWLLSISFPFSGLQEYNF